MNKRIKLLAEQALKHSDTDNDGLTVFDNDELKKFAELVASECVGIIEREASQYSAPVWSVEIINDICDRFGVQP